MTEPPRQSWESLQRPRPNGHAAVPPDHETVEEMVMRLTTGGPGAELLAYLRQRYIEHRDPPNCHEHQLRESEACRRLVADLEKKRDQGVEIAAARARSQT